MAARDRYSISFACPQCGQAGVLHLSEDDHPYMKKLHRNVDGVDGNFMARMKDEFDAVISCLSCGHQFTK